MASRARGEHGASAVEFALVVTPLLLLLFAIIEGGLLIRSYAGVGSVVSEATRRASIAGNDALADHRILQAVADRQAVAGNITKIVVFHAQPGDTGPPAACLVGPSTTAGAECNHYTAADLAVDASLFGCAGVDAHWCPSSRKTGLADPDYVGVYLETEHNLVSGFFARSVTLHDTAVLPIEDPT